jgi:hypothetical protein
MEPGPTCTRTVGVPSHPANREPHEADMRTGPAWLLESQAVQRASGVACRSIGERPNGGGNQAKDAGAREHLRSILDDVRAHGLTSVRRIDEELNRRGILA